MQLLGYVIVAIPIILLGIWWKDREQKAEQKRIIARRKSYLPMLECAPLYHTWIPSALVGAVRSNASACALARPVDVTNHLMAPGQGVILDNYGNLLFCYRFERSVVCPGGGRVEYSTLPPQQMTVILNKAFPNYCLKNGVWALKIVGQEDADLGFVNFYIKPFNDWVAVENYLKSGDYQI